MKSYCDKSTAKRGFIRMGGKPELFEASIKLVNGKWLVDDSALPKRNVKCSKIPIRGYRFPCADMTKHKTGAALIQHIVLFNKARHFVPGAIYHIGGQEVMI